MHSSEYLSFREPQAQDFFLAGPRSLKVSPVGVTTHKGIFEVAKQASRRKVRDQRAYMPCESGDSGGCRRTGLPEPVRIETSPCT